MLARTIIGAVSFFKAPCQTCLRSQAFRQGGFLKLPDFVSAQTKADALRGKPISDRIGFCAFRDVEGRFGFGLVDRAVDACERSIKSRKLHAKLPIMQLGLLIFAALKADHPERRFRKCGSERPIVYLAIYPLKQIRAELRPLEMVKGLLPNWTN